MTLHDRFLGYISLVFQMLTKTYGKHSFLFDLPKLLLSVYIY